MVPGADTVRVVHLHQADLLRATAAKKNGANASGDSQSAGEGGESAPAMRVRVDEFELARLMAVVEDGAAAKRFETEVGPVTMNLSGIDTQEGAEGKMVIAGESTYCEKFAVTGSFTVSQD